MKYITTLLSIAALSMSVFAAEDDAGFKPLFNGKDTSGWKLRNESGHNAWKVVDGVLKNDIAHARAPSATGSRPSASAAPRTGLPSFPMASTSTSTRSPAFR